MRIHLMVLAILIAIPMWTDNSYSMTWNEIKRLDRTDALESVRQFVELEFNGEELLRYHFSRLSLLRSNIDTHDNFECASDEGDGSHGSLLDFTVDFLFVVSRFEIVSIDIDEDRAKALIDYDRILSTEGPARTLKRKLVLDQRDHDLVTLNLIRQNGLWVFVDPPTWRVSLRALLEKYRDNLSSHHGFDFFENTDEWPLEVNNWKLKNYLYLKALLPADNGEIRRRADARETLQHFLEMEFNGARHMRFDYAQFSMESREQYRRQAKIAKCVRTDQTCDDFVYGKNLDHIRSNVVIVSHYTIKDFMVNGDHGVAVVDFRNLLTSDDNYGDRKFQPDKIEHDAVSYKLQRMNDRWYIIDPPTWRVSLSAMLENYRKLLVSNNPHGKVPEMYEAPDDGQTKELLDAYHYLLVFKQQYIPDQ